MITTTVALAALLAVACAVAPPLDAELKEKWESFKSEHGKSYPHEVEEAFRMKIFRENAYRIDKHNALYEQGLVSFKVGINRFADMLTHEIIGNPKVNHADAALKKVQDAESLEWPWTKKSVDWTKEGLVTPVKDEMGCYYGNYAFSAAGALEGQMFKKTKTLTPLSEQQLLDCSSSHGNDGCNSGSVENSFEYIKANDGLNSDSTYPFIGEASGNCTYNPADKAGIEKGYVIVKQGEKYLKKAVSKIGPVSARIDGTSWSFFFYESGIFYEKTCSSTTLDRSVLVVGYGSDADDQEYWLVKNSWGTTWGEKGYIRMARDKDNNCGIATQASYPQV